MKHFVLVHGSCHGAWCWYKLVNLLKLAGHRVTAVDLGGLNTRSLEEHVDPLFGLMRSIDDGDKVIVVGHSFSGLAISIAIEKFPERILVAVFVSAYMRNCSYPPITLVQETFKRTAVEQFLDTTFWCDQENMPTSVLFGPDFLTKKTIPEL